MPHLRHHLMCLPVIRHLRHKPRLFFAILMGAAVLLGLHIFAPVLRMATMSLIAWNCSAILYIGLAFQTMLTSSHESIEKRAQLYDDGESIILLLSTVAAILSVVAIIAELATTKDATGIFKGLHVGLAALTLLTSWTFIHTAFAFHYAHGYYAGLSKHPDHPCLVFPDPGVRRYMDFVYFSFVIGTSGQTADVNFASTPIRQVGLVHCVLSYLFNATVLALMINIAASLI